MAEQPKPMTDEWFREIGAAAGRAMGAAMVQANADAKVAGERLGKALATFAYTMSPPDTHADRAPSGKRGVEW